MKRYKLLFLVIVFGIASSSFSEDSRSEWVLREKARVSDDKVNGASDSSFDRRLPPVLPGEEVKDGDKTSKVWSTSGPVPINKIPERKRNRGETGDGIGVVVDGRGLLPVTTPSSQGGGIE